MTTQQFKAILAAIMLGDREDPASRRVVLDAITALADLTAEAISTRRKDPMPPPPEVTAEPRR